MGAMASQITSHAIVYSTVYSRRRSKKASKLRVTSLWEGNSPVTGEFPAQKASNAENVSIWWRHHGIYIYRYVLFQTKRVGKFIQIYSFSISHIRKNGHDFLFVS